MKVKSQDGYGIRPFKEGDLLYTSARPGRAYKKERPPTREDVDGWVQDARRLDIKSVICLLEKDAQLFKFYNPLKLHAWGLLGYYRECGFEVFFFHTTDHQPVPAAVKIQALAAFNNAQKPVILQDSGGIDRTGAVARYIWRGRAHVW